MVLRCDEHFHIPKKEKRGRRKDTGAFYFSPSLSLLFITTKTNYFFASSSSHAGFFFMMTTFSKFEVIGMYLPLSNSARSPEASNTGVVCV